MQISQGFAQLGNSLFQAFDAATKPPKSQAAPQKVPAKKALDLPAADQALTSGRTIPRGSFLDMRV